MFYQSYQWAFDKVIEHASQKNKELLIHMAEILHKSKPLRIYTWTKVLIPFAMVFSIFYLKEVARPTHFLLLISGLLLIASVDKLVLLGLIANLTSKNKKTKHLTLTEGLHLCVVFLGEISLYYKEAPSSVKSFRNLCLFLDYLVFLSLIYQGHPIIALLYIVPKQVIENYLSSKAQGEVFKGVNRDFLVL